MQALTREIVQGITEDVRARVERTMAPKDLEPPVSDPLVLEAKLQSARHDAELALRNERHGPTQDLLALAEGGDPIVRYLVLGTGWPLAWLRSRGVSDGTLGGWPKLQARAVTEATVGPDLARALKRLGQVPQLFESFATRHIGPPDRAGLGVRS
jgi:hypothetical protein